MLSSAEVKRSHWTLQSAGDLRHLLQPLPPTPHSPRTRTPRRSRPCSSTQNLRSWLQLFLNQSCTLSRMPGMGKCSSPMTSKSTWESTCTRGLNPHLARSKDSVPEVSTSAVKELPIMYFVMRKTPSKCSLSKTGETLQVASFKPCTTLQILTTYQPHLPLLEPPCVVKKRSR